MRSRALGLVPASVLVALPAAAQVPPGFVDLHIESPSQVALTEHQGIVDTHFGIASVTWTERVRAVCSSPCHQRIDVRPRHSFTLSIPGAPEPEPFMLHDMSGRLTMLVQPGNSAGLTAGRWLTALGALATTFGAIAVPFTYTGVAASDPPFRAASLGVLISGVTALAIGIPLVVTMRTKLRFTVVGP